MHRFFCSVCNRVKRTHSRPSIIVEHVKPAERIGRCNWHGGNRVQAQDRVKHVAGIGNTRKLSATTQKSKSK